jgi:hypothetical protein
MSDKKQKAVIIIDHTNIDMALILKTKIEAFDIPVTIVHLEQDINPIDTALLIQTQAKLLHEPLPLIILEDTRERNIFIVDDLNTIAIPECFPSELLLNDINPKEYQKQLLKTNNNWRDGSRKKGGKISYRRK